MSQQQSARTILTGAGNNVMPMQDWTVEKLNRDFSAHRESWNLLNNRYFGNHPLLIGSQIESLLHYFGDGSEYLCTFWAESNPEAMLILKKSNFGIWSSFLPNQAQIAPVVGQISSLEKLFKALPDFLAEIDLLCIDPYFIKIDSHSSLPSQALHHALTMRISLAGDFDSYWASRSKKLRANIKRYENRLDGDRVKVNFFAINREADLPDAIGRYAKLESSGWKGKEGTALEQKNLQFQFYLCVMKNAAEHDRATVYELWFDGELAASRLLIETDKMAVMLKTTYNETFSRYSPGRILLKEVVKFLFENKKIEIIEFYTDANADQLSWATASRPISHHMIYRNKLWLLLYNIGRAARKLVHFNSLPPTSKFPNQTIELLRHPDQFSNDIVQLFKRQELDDAEFGVDWFKNLLKTVFKNNSGVHFYVLRREGKPLAVIPLLIASEKTHCRISALANFYTAIYKPIVSENLTSDHLGDFFKEILKLHSRASEIRLAPMDPGSPAFSIIEAALRKCGLGTFNFFCFGNWYLPVVERWSEYLQSRSRTLRSTIRRMEKKFYADGGELELVDSSVGLEQAIIDYESVYAASWKNEEPYPEFVPGLIRFCAENGWLRLGIARIGGHPIAAQLWIVSHDKAKMYKMAHREEYKSYSPGTLLTAMLMENSLSSSAVREVDFLIGDDAYKQSWMSHRRERWGIIAFNPRTIQGAYGFVRESVWRWIKPLYSKVQSRLKTNRAAN